MTGIDRRQFVFSLTAAMTALSVLGSCRRLDPAGLPEGLTGLFGEQPEWSQLGHFYRQLVDEPYDEILVALARRLNWRPGMSSQDLTSAILEQMRLDFEEGRIGRPGGWGLAQTELAIYAVITSEAPPSAAAPESPESG